MTDTLTASPRLERPREAPLRGVCAALARSTGTDPALWRVLAVVLTVFAGLGIALYLVAVATIPREGEQQALADRLLHGPDRTLRPGQWVLLALLACALLSLASDVDGLVTLAVLSGLGLLWWRGRLTPVLSAAGPAVDPDTLPGSGAVRVGAAWPDTAYTGATAAADPWAKAYDSGTYDTGPYDTAPYEPPYTLPAPVATPPRRARSPLTGATVSLAAVVAGVLLLLGTQGGVSVPAEVVLAAALGVVGLGLVVGSWWGRSWGLVALAVLLGLSLTATAGARPTIEAGLGERRWVPVAEGSYRLGVGEATLDLRSLPVREGSTLALDARVEVGHLVVLVPDGVRVALDARAQLGEIVLPGESVEGQGVQRQVDLGPPGSPQVRLDAQRAHRPGGGASWLSAGATCSRSWWACWPCSAPPSRC